MVSAALTKLEGGARLLHRLADEADDGARLWGGPVQFLLGGSGHNAGVINPPSANKHGYWTNEAMPESAEEWWRPPPAPKAHGGRAATSG
ncbi:MAG: hypothetical protein M3N07_06820 [Pseudomonadota bacterium]|nr:hypothetical protein [Pseudomonadota bacterium]